MPRKGWINKKEAATFQLLFRSQNDPLLHDETASERALYQVNGPATYLENVSVSHDISPSKRLDTPVSDETGLDHSASTSHSTSGLRLSDLERELDLDSIRANEGEAAEHGIYYDDTSYDYMQHLRDIDAGGTYSFDAVPMNVKGKGKDKMVKLEDALRETSLDDSQDGFSTMSGSTRPKTYQDQQDVPDEIAGFQPDMDPRLREALEALDDEAYVDQQDEEDVFGTLTSLAPGNEVDLNEFEAMYEEENDDAWESDATEKPSKQTKDLPRPTEGSTTGKESDRSIPGGPSATSELSSTQAAVAEDGDWLRDFAKDKKDNAKKSVPKVSASVDAPSAVPSHTSALYSLPDPARKKRRKGALTNPSNYSMSSASVARTEGLQLLDARFDKIEAMYALDEAEEGDDEDGGVSVASGLSRQSKLSTLSTSSFADGDVRTDLDGMMDGFLSQWNEKNPGGGKRKGAKGKRGKNGNEALGLRMLDEIRGELGPARIRRSQNV